MNIQVEQFPKYLGLLYRLKREGGGPKAGECITDARLTGEQLEVTEQFSEAQPELTKCMLN